MLAAGSGCEESVRFDCVKQAVERVVEAVRPPRSLKRRPLVQVAFSLQIKPDGDISLLGLESSSIPLNLGVAEYDLTLAIQATARGTCAELRFNTELFTPARARALVLDYERVLAVATQSPHFSINHLLAECDCQRQD